MNNVESELLDRYLSEDTQECYILSVSSWESNHPKNSRNQRGTFFPPELLHSFASKAHTNLLIYSRSKLNL